MSAAAASAPPPNGQDPVPGDGSSRELYARNGMKAGEIGGTRGSKRVFPHIEDLLAARPDVNALSQIRKLLVEAEAYAKQADTHLDFRRPEIALQEYIKASIIVVDLIPRHKEFPDLRSDRGDLHRAYARLQKRISSQHERFEEVKTLIKDDNLRSGVRPISNVPSAELDARERFDTDSKHESLLRQTQVVQGSVASSQSSELGTTDSNHSSVHFIDNRSTRLRPPVQPKPNALHGQSIKSSSSSETFSISTEKDLAARFSRLRGPGPHSPVQDPRIRTQPIGMQDKTEFTTMRESNLSLSLTVNYPNQRLERPLGPRDMPQVPIALPRTQKVLTNVGVPSMPKVPDAVYSPSRNSDNTRNFDMLQSSTRNVVGTAGRPLTVAPNGRNILSIVARDGIGHETGSHSVPDWRGPERSSNFYLPESDTVTAQELVEYLKRGSDEFSVLLVDIRDREDFDEGHIMSHSIICIEPIVLRNEISAAELEQSLVLSPDNEQRLFETRDTFDLIIYYDQSSSSTSTRRKAFESYDSDAVLSDFSKALFDYGYERRLKRPPRLLVGGLDAWIDLVGPGALESTQSSDTTSKNGVRPSSKNFARASRAWETNRLRGRKTVHKIKSLSADEQIKLEKTLREKAEANSADVLSYIRTTEDFFRRFPEPSAIQESMVSPPPFTSIESHNEVPHNSANADGGLTFQNGIESMPDIPTRPAPALPRQSYTGISERNNFLNSNALTEYPFEYKETMTITQSKSPYGRTPLQNAGNHCYMNSVLQALKGTGIFRDYFLRWSEQVDPVPRLKGELNAPQLMAWQISNLVRDLCGGKYETHSAKDLKLHCYRIHEAPKSDKFGGIAQHDAQEYLGFLFQSLESDLNISRHRTPLKPLSDPQEEIRRKQPDITSSWMEWQRYLHSNNSFVTRNFRALTLSTYTCHRCKFFSKSWDNVLQIELDIPERGEGTLEESLNERFLRTENITDFRCDRCSAVGAEKIERFARCPEVLIFMFRRHGYDKEKNVTFKRKSVIRYPLDNLSLDPYCIASGNRGGSEASDKGFLKPFIYDCSAVIMHKGASIKSGHYWTMVKERDAGTGGREKWFKYNDTILTSVENIKKETMTNPGPYLLFYERRRILGFQ